MDFEKDYYAALGVLPSIEPSALRAVYLALQKIYHPDVHNGSRADAEARIKQINEAYTVLSDPAIRAKYDAAQAPKRNGSGSFADETQDQSNNPETDKELAEAWSYIVAYRSDVERMRAQLQKISPALAFQFKLTILDNKAAKNARQISDQMEAEYLVRYFGSSAKIREFAVEALRAGRRDVAIEINRVITVLGSPSYEHEATWLLRTVCSRMKFEPCSKPQTRADTKDKSSSAIGEGHPTPLPPPLLGEEPVAHFKILALAMLAALAVVAAIAITRTA